MNLERTLAVAFFMGLFGLAMLIVLWPGEKSARNMLAKWGVPDPSAEETVVAVRYLRRRRFWYPWLYLVLPFIPGATGLSGNEATTTIAGTLLSGALLAELFAQRPARGARREAVLEHRGTLDFAPMWTLVVSAIVELVAFGYLAAEQLWVTLAVAVVAVAASWAIVLLAVRRPADGTRRADLALRHRSARVALGLGIGTAAMVCWHPNNFPTFLAFIVSIAAILAIASPPRRLPPIAARAG
ncbi:hypothetical protein FPZ12_014000 [Amycolatopsis acidicola]|uniref:Uncharacterized protein n=1 Tax=Amycolatopsis acidicola TaxID=2596893 RepID=A0A5N0V5G5_9PSEU|nr:hypothetical protein [Amycolatopsis acidicola]KAA9161617.1 hypothetical protein FPZ12_014000 [Amycolatopsis acidicola]